MKLTNICLDNVLKTMILNVMAPRVDKNPQTIFCILNGNLILSPLFSTNNFNDFSCDSLDINKKSVAKKKEEEIETKRINTLYQNKYIQMCIYLIKCNNFKI